MRLWMIAVITAAGLCVPAEAVVIDSFSAGTISQGPIETAVDLLQTGLPTASVIGGERDWFALYGGSLSVDAGGSGTLGFYHDRGVFEVAMVQYGRVQNGSPMSPLNTDLLAGGDRQFTLRIKNALAADPTASRLPIALVINVRSGVEGPSAAGASFVVRPKISGDEYLLQVPFSSFIGVQKPVDFSDIDGIGLSFSVEDHASLVIDEIATSAGLPGDYNLDGRVDAGDYTLWRDRVGTNATLPNENPAAATPGIVDEEDYLFWKSRFGDALSATSGGASGAVVVPEPAAVVLFVSLLLLSPHRRRRL
jgi:hypothetical protein